jgi:hypothetical protein
MEIHVLVEEESAEAALNILVPRILKGRAGHRIITFRGKQDLLGKLPQRLAGYRRRLEHEDLRILVLIDEDRSDCRALKAKLEDIARQAGLSTKTSCNASQRFQVVTRIAVEELEAWYFGDESALYAAYDRLPATLHRRKPYRDPDAIKGGTCEALHRELKEAGYDLPVFPKIKVAREVAGHMDPARNRSPSFRAFCAGLESFLT